MAGDVELGAVGQHHHDLDIRIDEIDLALPGEDIADGRGQAVAVDVQMIGALPSHPYRERPFRKLQAGRGLYRLRRFAGEQMLSDAVSKCDALPDRADGLVRKRYDDVAWSLVQNGAGAAFRIAAPCRFGLGEERMLS